MKKKIELLRMWWNGTNRVFSFWKPDLLLVGPGKMYYRFKVGPLWFASTINVPMIDELSSQR